MARLKHLLTMSFFFIVCVIAKMIISLPKSWKAKIKQVLGRVDVKVKEKKV